MSNPWNNPAVEHELPSGMKIKMRERLSALSLMRAGHENVVEVFERVANGEELTDPGEALAVQDAIIMTLAIEPAIVANPALANGKTIFYLGDIPDDDYAALAEIAAGETGDDDEATFRGDGPSPSDGGNGEVLEPKPKRVRKRAAPKV